MTGSKKGVPSAMTTVHSLIPEKQAKVAAGNKNRKYKQLANDNGYSFLPIIFESTGRIAEDTVKLLTKWAEYGAETKKIPAGVIYGYMVNRLSCVFQRCVANAIISRASSLNGHTTRAAAREYVVSHEFVSTHGRYNSTGGRRRSRR